jgi:hypothetical protein
VPKITKVEYIKLEDVHRNPCRDLKEWPLEKGRLTFVRTEVIERGFAQALPARKHKGVIQIAFGHHRVDVLKKIGKYRFGGEWHEGEVPVVLGSYSYDDMVGLFTGDNLKDTQTVSTLLETIAVNRKRLMEALQESETIEYFKQHFSQIWERCQKKGRLKTQKALDTARALAKKGGVGEPILVAYLGKNYELLKKWHVAEALLALKAMEERRLSKAAYIGYADLALAKAFRQKVAPNYAGSGEKPAPLVPVTRQPRVAKKITKKRTKTAEVKAKVEAEYEADMVTAQVEDKPPPKKPNILISGRVPARTTVDEVVDEYVDEEQDDGATDGEAPAPDPVGTALEALSKRFTSAEKYLGYAADECTGIVNHIKKTKLNIDSVDPVKKAKWRALLIGLEEAVKEVLVIFGTDDKKRITLIK